MNTQKKQPKYVENKAAKRIKFLLLITFFFGFVLAGILLYRNLQAKKQDRSELKALQETVAMGENGDTVVTAGEILPKYAALYAENPDLAGWLKIPGTALDAPVMYRADSNDYYLSHDFYGNESASGLLVLDNHCAPDASGMNILIHGHNMKNGDMFGTLGEYISKDFYLKHPTILFDTLYEERTYEVMAVFRSSVNENDTDFRYYEYINFSSEDDFRIYYLNSKANALYETGVFAAYGDELITLSTCEYSKENGRLVVLGRRKS